MNLLYYGDNLPILRDHVATASVDFIYLDPPFNSNRSYNVSVTPMPSVSRPAVLTLAPIGGKVSGRAKTGRRA
jgi:hypothetical protein